MPRPSRDRALAACLVLALLGQGCASVHLKEHRHPGPAVSVKVLWDDHGARRLVGGVGVRIEPFDGEPIEAVTRADAPLLIDWLSPGLHRIVLTLPGMAPVERTFDLRPGRRMSVRVDVDAFERRDVEHDDDREEAPDGALFVLKIVGAVLVVGIVVLAIAMIEGALDDDDDDREWRKACEVCRPHRRDDPTCSCSCHL